MSRDLLRGLGPMSRADGAASCIFGEIQVGALSDNNDNNSASSARKRRGGGACCGSCRSSCVGKLRFAARNRKAASAMLKRPCAIQKSWISSSTRPVQRATTSDAEDRHAANTHAVNISGTQVAVKPAQGFASSRSLSQGTGSAPSSSARSLNSSREKSLPFAAW